MANEPTRPEVLGDVSIDVAQRSEELCQLPAIDGCIQQTREAINDFGYTSVENSKQEASLSYLRQLSSTLERIWDRPDEQLITLWNDLSNYRKNLKGKRLSVHHPKYSPHDIGKLEGILTALEPHKRAGYIDSCIARYAGFWGSVPGYDDKLQKLIEKMLPTSESGKKQARSLEQRLHKKVFEGVLDEVYYKLFDAHIPLLAMVKQTEGEIASELAALDGVKDLTPDNLKKSLELEDDKKRIQELHLRRHNGSISKRLFEYLYWCQGQDCKKGIPPLSARNVGNEAVVIATEELEQMASFKTIQPDGSIKDWKKDPRVLARKMLIIFPEELGNNAKIEHGDSH